MCDPISGLALAGSALSAGISYMGQQDTLAAQQSANDDWIAQQRAASQAAAAKDLANQQKQNAALSTSEQALSQKSQEANQQTAQASLTGQMLAGSPAADNSNVQLLGQPQGGASTGSRTTWRRG